MKIQAAKRLQASALTASARWGAYPKSVKGFPQGCYLENYDGKESIAMIVPDYPQEAIIIAVQGGIGVSDQDIDIPMKTATLERVNSFLKIYKVPPIDRTTFNKGFSK